MNEIGASEAVPDLRDLEVVLRADAGIVLRRIRNALVILEARSGRDVFEAIVVVRGRKVEAPRVHRLRDDLELRAMALHVTAVHHATEATGEALHELNTVPLLVEGGRVHGVATFGEARLDARLVIPECVRVAYLPQPSGIGFGLA